MKWISRDSLVIVCICAWMVLWSASCAPVKNYLFTKDRKKCIQDDNYCDCGDDEPNTSACSGLQLPNTAYFTCRNTGYLNQAIPQSRVHDKVCDCCDGSDEIIYTCINTCDEENRIFVEEINKKNEKLYQGKLLRDELIAMSKKAIFDAMSSLKTNRQLVKQHESEMETIKLLLQPLESVEKKDFKQAVDEARLVSLAGLRNEQGNVISKEQLNLLIASLVISGKVESVKETLLELDEIYSIDGPDPDDVTAIKIARHGYSHDTSMNTDISEEGNIGEISKNSNLITLDICTSMAKALALTRLNEDGIKLIFHEALARALAYGNDVVVQAFRFHGLPKLVAMMAIHSSPHEIAKRGFIDPEADRLRRNLTDLNTTVLRLHDEIKNAESISKLNFGKNSYLYPLYGNCYQVDHKGSTYEICPFKEAKQNNVLLGKYSGFKEENGKNDDMVKLIFDQGEYCFVTKRKRTMIVTMICDLEVSLHDIEEPSVCEYTAVLSTPLACMRNPYPQDDKSENSSPING